MNQTKVLKIASGLKILYTVLYILCIVCASLLLLFGMLFTVMGEIGVWEDEAFIEMIGDFTDLTGVQFFSFDRIMYGAVITMIGTIVLYIMVTRFYKYICTVGDIFDQVVIKKMQTLGIVYIVLPPVVSMIAGAVISGFTNFKLAISNTPQLTMGIVYLILTVVFSYGADLKEGKIEENEESKQSLGDEE